MRFETLPQLLLAQAERYPDDPYVRFWREGKPSNTYSYSETWTSANCWGAALRERGIARDEPVAIALPNGPEFVGAYYGVLVAGGAPMPLPPLRRIDADDAGVAQLAARMAQTGARVVVVPEAQAGVSAALRGLDRPVALTLRDVPPSADELPSFRGASTVGLLQFTSGTTGGAKPVELGQDALLIQAATIDRALAVDRDADWALSWLPLYHDMGLIGFLITPAYLGGFVELMPTEEFIRSPGLWISTLSLCGASITGGPPSAYHLCARRQGAGELERHDLGRVRIALVGAEPVSAQSLDAFATTYAPAGFRREALMPTYGLAENGLAVTMPPCGRGPLIDVVDAGARGDRRMVPVDEGRGRPFVSVGRALPGITIEILDDRRRPVANREVGEIAIRSPSLMRGYRGDPVATAAVLEDGRLVTGDLGYVSDGELFVIGRRKEILIVGGRNYWPGDLEEAVADIVGVHRGRVVAISYEDAERSTEAVVVMAETTIKESDARDELCLQIRRTLAARDYPVHDVVLLPPKSIESTANGKLKRAECRSRYLAREVASAG